MTDIIPSSPPAAGYRLYVNELMDRQQLTLQETQRINDALNLKMEERFFRSDSATALTASRFYRFSTHIPRVLKIMYHSPRKLSIATL